MAPLRQALLQVCRACESKFGHRAGQLGYLATSKASKHSLPSVNSTVDPTPFWERKLNKRFAKMDVNKDGFVDQVDLDGHINIVRQTRIQDEESIQRLRKLYEAAWKRVWSFGVSSRARRVSQREFIRGYTHIIKSRRGRENLCQTIEDLLGGCFDTFDMAFHKGDSTQEMSEEEFIEYVQCWNLTGPEGKQLFSDISKPGTGRVTRQQYLLAAWDFYFSMDEQIGPGDNFYGRVRRSTHLIF